MINWFKKPTKSQWEESYNKETGEGFDCQKCKRNIVDNECNGIKTLGSAGSFHGIDTVAITVCFKYDKVPFAIRLAQRLKHNIEIEKGKALQNCADCDEVKLAVERERERIKEIAQRLSKEEVLGQDVAIGYGALIYAIDKDTGR